VTLVINLKVGCRYFQPGAWLSFQLHSIADLALAAGINCNCLVNRNNRPTVASSSGRELKITLNGQSLKATSHIQSNLVSRYYRTLNYQQHLTKIIIIMIPWACGKPMAWDVTVPDTFAE